MKKGNYKTKQREYILDFLQANADKHFTVEEILACAVSKENKIGQTTLYRNLEKLANENAIEKLQLPGGAGACFCFTGTKQKHIPHHLVCTACGEIAHLDCDRIRLLSAHILKEHHFIFDARKTVFYGLCRNCNGNS